MSWTNFGLGGDLLVDVRDLETLSGDTFVIELNGLVLIALKCSRRFKAQWTRQEGHWVLDKILWASSPAIVLLMNVQDHWELKEFRMRLSETNEEPQRLEEPPAIVHEESKTNGNILKEPQP